MAGHRELRRSLFELRAEKRFLITIKASSRVARGRSSGFVRMKTGGCNKYLKALERVKGIEPSYSAWKAAALPLSYTRVGADQLSRQGRGLNRQAPVQPLNMRRIPAYTDVSINNERR